MGDTKIEWCDRVWNVVSGCTKVSAGCTRCYAERMSKRLAGRAGYPEDGFKVTLHPERLEEPLKWKKPSRIFVCSMGDLFHKDVTSAFIHDVLIRIEKAPHHTFMVLTKRIERANEFIRNFEVRTGYSFAQLYSYVWLGVSVEDQKTADERIPLLLQTPAAKRFVSYEPAIGPVDFRHIKIPGGVTDSFGGWYGEGGPQIDWLIMGGESGPGARPLHPDWARSARSQCKAAGIPYFFKQWGEWTHEFPTGISLAHRAETFQHGQHFYRVGKKAAGCLLDGKEYKELPTI